MLFLASSPGCPLKTSHTSMKGEGVRVPKKVLPKSHADSLADPQDQEEVSLCFLSCSVVRGKDKRRPEQL